MIASSAQRVTFGVALAFFAAATLPASERAIARGVGGVGSIGAGIGTGISSAAGALGGLGATTAGIGGTVSGSASDMTGMGGSSAATGSLRGSSGASLTSDGVHPPTAVGRDEVVRGTVTAIAGDSVAFVTTTGETRTVRVAKDDLQRLAVRVGSTVGSVSHDFGHSVMLSLIAQPGSFLGNVYVGRVASIAANRVEIAYGDGTQAFAATPATLHQLQQLTGSTVALVSLDGQHVKSLLAAQTFKRLEQAQGLLTTNGAIAANVVASAPDRVTLQLNNGDVLGFWVRSAAIGARAASALTLTQLGAGRARLTSGAHSAIAYDADLCSKDGACATSANGTVVTKTPTTVAVQFANGDVVSFLGNSAAFDAGVGSTVSVTQAEVAAAGR